MRNIRKIVLVSVAFVMLLSIVVYASGYNPGSEQDPLVTLSYVDSKINELKSYIDNKVSNSGTASSGTASTASTYQIVSLQSGQKLIGKESTEIILRSGEALAIDNGANGISDLTDGKDLRSGDTVYQNHLLLVPRDDGRGIKAITEIWIMVKGGYEIK